MKINVLAFCCVLLIALSLSGCHKDTTVDTEWASIATRSTSVETSSGSLNESSESTIETRFPATIDYFTNVDKGYQPENIIEEIGPCSLESSEIGLYVWQLPDGAEASVLFSAVGIQEIIIDSEDEHFLLYDRSQNF